MESAARRVEKTITNKRNILEVTVALDETLVTDYTTTDYKYKKAFTYLH